MMETQQNSTTKTSSITPGTDDRRALRRQGIVDVAARIFAEAGYDNTEMECVADKAGIAKGTLYLYFEGKAGPLLRLR